MKFNNPRVLADALSNLSIQPDPNKQIEIQDTVIPVALVAGSVDATSTFNVGGAVTITTATRSTAGTTALYTVPTGRAAKIYTVWIMPDTIATDASGDYGRIDINSVPAAKLIMTATSVASAGPVTYSPTVLQNFTPNYVVLTAGQVVNLVTNGTTDFIGGVAYIEYTP